MWEVAPSKSEGPLLRAASLEVGCGLWRAGLRAGDAILALDGLVPRDVIDLQFELPGARAMTVQRGGDRIALALDEGDGSTDGLELDEAVPGGIRTCTNHCEFCFIRGTPPGLRSTLYVFDDDYRYSFLWGTFLTLTNLSEEDWGRIAYQRLSPLNVSVHATEPETRRVLLNNRHAPDVLPQLQRLGRLGVEVNAQVVLCAGLNDGPVLNRTISDLAGLGDVVRALAVVPVGLTRYSRVAHIRRPTPDEAATAVAQCERWQAALQKQIGRQLVYPSDELYLLAGRDNVPSAAEYAGYPLLTNGVGLLRTMQDAWERLLARRRRFPPRRRVVWVTGSLAAPALQRMADLWAAAAGWQPEVVVVENRFFGGEITASGLLAGGDLIEALRALPPEVEDVVLPRGAFGFEGTTTLDGLSAEEVGAAHPGRVHLAATPDELLEILTWRGGGPLRGGPPVRRPRRSGDSGQHRPIGTEALQPGGVG